MWTVSEEKNCRSLVQLALEEDLEPGGDLTSKAVLPANTKGKAVFISRESGIIAGLPIVQVVFEQVSRDIRVELLLQDGTEVQPGDKLAQVSGPLDAMLTGERTALNFLQRLSGIATKTNQFVKAVGNSQAKILDTRKTTPGYRSLEKYAVRCGGGYNHRRGLYDGILIKDNHLAALADKDKAITKAVNAARMEVGKSHPVELEIDRLDQLDEGLAAQPDIILLDNMAVEDMAEAVRRRNDQAPEILLEASGGISLETIADIAATGIDRISVGALTHSAAAFEIGFDYESP